MKNLKINFNKWMLLYFLPPFWIWQVYLLLHKKIKGSITETATINQPLNRIKDKKRFAIIGCGLSGIQALKECYAQGHEAVCMDQAGGIGGLWRYRTSTDLASVYQSTHIDSGRDINFYGDASIEIDEPLVLHNTKIADYLRNNVNRLDLYKHIRLRTKVTKITPHAFDQSTERWQWRVDSETLPNHFDTDGDADPILLDQPGTKRSEIFDGVLICTGRHSQPLIPNVLGRETFKGFQCHSAHYRSPSTHHLHNKTVIVVGIGNSGADIATELAPLAKKVYLVSRSGAWVYDFKGKPVNQIGFGNRFLANLTARLPWQWLNQSLRSMFQKGKLGNQTLLDEAGLKPDFGPIQAQPTLTGLGKQLTLHNEIENKRIHIYREITRITESGVYFDQDNVETPVDAIIWATGYKQTIDCLDPDIINLAFDRNDNQVTLYKMIWPISEYQHSIGFINYVQGASFVTADLQVRAFFQVFNGDCQLPNLITQQAEDEAIKAMFSSQFIDRPRHHIQAGLFIKYYDDLAQFIGCYPSFRKILLERPSALWHAWFTPITALNYRLVGPGKLKNAEEEITKREKALWVTPFDQNIPYLIQTIALVFALVIAKCLGYYVGYKQYEPKTLLKFLRKNVMLKEKKSHTSLFTLPVFIFNLFKKIHSHLSMDDINLLKKTALFNNTTPKQFSRILHFSRLKKYKKNKIVFKQEAVAHALYIIVKGSVQAFTYDETGKKIILARLQKGDYVGEQALLNVTKRHLVSIETVEETIFVQIHAKALSACWEKDQALLEKLKRKGVQEAIQVLTETTQIYNNLKDTLKELEPHASILDLSDKATVFKFGDMSDHAYLILQGKVEIHLPGTMKDKPKLTIFKNHLFGEQNIIENKARNTSAFAVGPVRLLVFNGEKFREIYQKQAALQHLLSFYKKAYQLPVRGVVEQYFDISTDMGPILKNIFKLKNGRTIILTMAVQQAILKMSLIKTPEFVRYRHEFGKQTFVEIGIRNQHLVYIEIHGEWDYLQMVRSLLNDEVISDVVLEHFPDTGKLLEVIQCAKPEIICNCLSITRDQILYLVNQGVTDYETISSRTNVGTVCGSCRYLVSELSGINPWIDATMKKIIQHNDDVRTYFIKPINKQIDSFLPGQHILVRAKINNRVVERCYSMSDIQRENGLRITIKKEKQGLLTPWLFDANEDEIKVNITQPQGNFIMDPIETIPALCFAGGIGITPFISYAHELLSTKSNKKLHIFYSASKKHDFIFTDELNEITQKNKTFTIHYRDSESHGSLKKEEIIELVKSMPNSLIYICGSERFIALINQTLEEIQYDATKIFVEKFVLPEVQDSGLLKEKMSA